MTSNQKDQTFDSTNLIVFLLRWRKPLLIISVVAAIISAVVSLLIEPKFKSTVIMFPATTSSVSKALLIENPTGKHDIMEFGEEEEAEQLLQVLNSDEIRDHVSWKYDLMRHYDIDTAGEYKMTELIEEYESNVKFKRTEFQSVRIDVLDKSPDTAAMIANDIAARLDSVMSRMQKDRALTAMMLVKNEYLELKHYIREMEDSMTVIRKLGVHEYEVQIEMITEQYSKALAEGNARAVKSLEEKLDALAEYGGAYVSLRGHLEYETEKLTQLRAKYREAKVDAEQNIPHKFIVNHAFAAEKKSYPIRWLIVVISTLAAFILAILVIISIENYRRFAPAGRRDA